MTSVYRVMDEASNPLGDYPADDAEEAAADARADYEGARRLGALQVEELTPRVSFSAGMTPEALILERAELMGFKWRLSSSDSRTLEAAAGASAPGDGILTPEQVLSVCSALWTYTQGEAEDEAEQEQRDEATLLRFDVLGCLNIEEV